MPLLGSETHLPGCDDVLDIKGKARMAAEIFLQGWPQFVGNAVELHFALLR